MKSILVVQMGSWSEATLSSFVVPALKERHPDAEVTLAVRRDLADWTPCLHWDRLILVNDADLLGRLHLALRLRARRYDGVLDLSPDTRIKKYLRLGVGSAVKFIEPVVTTISTPLIEKNLQVLSQINAAPQKLNFKLRVRRHVHQEILTKLRSSGLEPGNFLALAPGASLPRKGFTHLRWNYFPEFVKLILSKSPWPCLLLGGLDDRRLADSLNPFGSKRIVSWMGDLTREETLATAGEALGFVGNDSGVSMAAASAGVPSVILYGPSSAVMRRPPGAGQNVVCLESRVPCAPCGKIDFDWNCRDNVCMKFHSPEEVWRALIQVLGPRPDLSAAITRL